MALPVLLQVGCRLLRAQHLTLKARPRPTGVVEIINTIYQAANMDLLHVRVIKEHTRIPNFTARVAIMAANTLATITLLSNTINVTIMITIMAGQTIKTAEATAIIERITMIILDKDEEAITVAIPMDMVGIEWSAVCPV